MKTLNDFLASEQNAQVLSVVELVAVRGGENPPERPSDPWKTLNGKKTGLYKQSKLY